MEHPEVQGSDKYEPYGSDSPQFFTLVQLFDLIIFTIWVFQSKQLNCLTDGGKKELLTAIACKIVHENSFSSRILAKISILRKNPDVMEKSGDHFQSQHTK